MPPRRVEIRTTGHTVRSQVRQLRERQGLTLAALCTRLNADGLRFTPSTVSEIENGGRRVDVDDLVILASALGVSPLTLLMPVTEGGDEPVETSAVALPVTAQAYWRWLRTEDALQRGAGPRNNELFEFQLRSRPGWMPL